MADETVPAGPKITKYHLLVQASVNDQGHKVYSEMGEAEGKNAREAVAAAMSSDSIDVQAGDTVLAIPDRSYDPQKLVLTIAGTKREGVRRGGRRKKSEMPEAVGAAA